MTTRRAAGVLLWVILLGIPVGLGEYWAFIMALAYIYVLLGVGLNFLLGYAGQFSFGHSALYGFGAYAAGLFMMRLGVPFLVAIAFGTVLTCIVALLIAIPALRVSGIYLGIITVGFVELFLWTANHWRDLTFGPTGFRLPVATLLGFPLSSAVRTYYFIMVVVVTLVVLARWLVRSKVGRALVAIRDNEAAALTLGVDPIRYKILAFVLNAGYAGVAGGLYAVLLNYLSPATFGLFEAIMQFNMVIVGGIGTFYGPIIGAVGLTILFEFARGVTGFQEILSGLLLVTFILFIPRGVAYELNRVGWLKDEPLHVVQRGQIGGWRLG